MKAETFTIRQGGDLSRLVAYASALIRDKSIKVTVAEHRNNRSDQQNRYLFGVVYPTILRHLDGWDKDDVHEWCLGEWSGWEVLEGLGRRRMKPIKRSSKLNTVEFNDYIEFIQRTMAERFGIYVPDPNEEIEA